LLHDGITRSRPNTTDADAIAAGTVQARGGIVELHVPLALLEDAELPARHPAWVRVLADLAGQYGARRPIAQNPAARFPGRPLRRHSETNFARCIGVACRRPASQCDQDHRLDHAKGGRTEPGNLAPACPRHNQLKNRGWRLLRTGPRTFLWISPLGRKHRVTLDPVAPALPAPIPGTREPDPPDLPEYGHPAPSFEPLTQHGRPLANATSAEPSQTRKAIENDPDPPPF